MNWFKLECTTRAFVTALQLTVRYEMSVIIIIIIIIIIAVFSNVLELMSFKLLYQTHILYAAVTLDSIQPSLPLPLSPSNSFTLKSATEANSRVFQDPYTKCPKLSGL